MPQTSFAGLFLLLTTAQKECCCVCQWAVWNFLLTLTKMKGKCLKEKRDFMMNVAVSSNGTFSTYSMCVPISQKNMNSLAYLTISRYIEKSTKNLILFLWGRCNRCESLSLNHQIKYSRWTIKYNTAHASTVPQFILVFISRMNLSVCLFRIKASLVMTWPF